MSQISTGPRGNPMIAVYATEAEAEAAQARVFLNGQHIEGDRQPVIRDRVLRGEISITDVPRDAKNITRRWADPRQTDFGEWYIVVPDDETRLRARDDRTGELGDTAPDWQGANTLEPAMLDDIVEHGGKTWRSTVDYNVWEPGVSGWREVVAEGYPVWVQPTGAHDAYPLGTKVTHNGQNWENTSSEANVWEPGVFGWVRI